MNESPGVIFRTEWEGPGGVQSPELAATWCRLEIWVDDYCLTQVEEVGSHSTRRSIFVPLYPLAEWAAFNWWLLKFHSRPVAFPVRTWSYGSIVRRGRAQFDWLRSHNLRSVGDGYPWPDVTVVPEGNYSRVAWNGAPTPRGGLRYLGSGSALVPSLSVENSLTSLIETVITRLDEMGVSKSPLQDEWEAINAQDADEQSFSQAAARLGLDPYGVDAETAAVIEQVAEAIDERLTGDFFDSVPVDALKGDSAWVARAFDLVDSAEPAPLIDQLPLLRSSATAARAEAGRDPWEIGLAQARAVRDASGTDVSQRFDVDQYVSTVSVPEWSNSVDAVGVVTAGPHIALSRRGVADSRFTTARGLWHAVGQSESSIFLLTHSYNYIQKIERAFAAELLAPAMGIEKLVGDLSTGVPASTASAIASHYGVSTLVVDHQLTNNVLS